MVDIARRASTTGSCFPVAVGAPEPFTLIAVWAQRDSWGRHTDYGMEALRESEDLLVGDAMVVGDFNSNAIWDDQLGTSATHSEIVKWLGARGFVRAYHHSKGEAQGRESLPAYAQHKCPNRLFHIDRCFLPTGLLERGSSPGSSSATTLRSLWTCDSHPPDLLQAFS